MQVLIKVILSVVIILAATGIGKKLPASGVYPSMDSEMRRLYNSQNGDVVAVVMHIVSKLSNPL